jgi:hypothetical protein
LYALDWSQTALSYNPGHTKVQKVITSTKGISKVALPVTNSAQSPTPFIKVTQQGIPTKEQKFYSTKQVKNRENGKNKLRLVKEYTIK